MIFGYDIAPTESLFLFIISITISLFLIYVLYLNFMNNRKSFILYFVTSIIPFLLIYYFFEVISLPGFTQLETKHGMLVYPLLIAIIVSIPKYASPLITYTFLGFVFVGQLIGMHNTFDQKHTEWNLIVKKVNEFVNNGQNGKIIMDGRSREVYHFYNQKVNSNVMINYTWESMDSLEAWIKGKERLVLLLNDYKSYTPLTLEQNWNAGSGSMDRVEKLNFILNRVNKDYYLDDSYVSYPTFLYLLKKKVDGPDNIVSAGVWQHHLKDLDLPIKSDKKNDILSSIIIQPGDSVEVMSDSILVFNLEKSENIKYGDLVGSIIINRNAINLIKGENIWDVFAEFHDANINENKVFHSWYHKPLVSGSIRYNGSYFKHKAHIYSLGLGKELDNKIKVINTSEISSIRIWN